MGSPWQLNLNAPGAGFAAVYTDVLVPRLFAPWAEVLVDTIDARPGMTVVDVATGAGTVARAVAARLGRLGRVLACDISPAMLAAAQAVPMKGAAPITYTLSPADAMPYPSGSADAVTCQHGLQFFADRAAAVREMRRVCVDGGRLALSVWRRLADSPALGAAWAAAEQLFGAESMDPVPWSIGDPRLLTELATAGGWRNVEVLDRDLPIEFDGGPAQVVAALATTPIGDRLAALDEAGLRHLIELAADRLGPLVEADGAVRSTTGAYFLLARA